MAEMLQLDDEHEVRRPDLDQEGGTPEDKRRRFMALARDRFTESAVGEHVTRAKMLKDRAFAGGGAEQWINENNVNVQQQRWSEGKPAITTNQIPSYTRQVTNSMRESRPAIQYVGVDDDHDPELAEVLQGLARHVEQNSMADVAYDTAAEHMVEGGRGWVYVRTDFVHDETDEQDIFIKRVRNPEVIFPDPSCLEFDYSDMRYLHHVEDMPLDTYNRRFPHATIASASMFEGIGAQKIDWHWGANRVRVSHYYYMEHVEKTLVAVAAVPDDSIPAQGGMRGMPPGGPPGMPPQGQPSPMGAGQPAPGSTGSGGIPGAPPQAPPEPKPPKLRFLEDLTDDEKSRVIVDEKGEPAARRKVKVPQPMCAVINGIGIIEGNEDKTAGAPVAGRYIPYVPFIGSERDLDGEVDLRGMVRDMAQAQQMVNFWQSALTEAIGKVTHGTWVIAEGQITDGNKKVWEESNRKNFAFLPYKPMTLGQVLAPAPHWESQTPEIQSIVVALQIAENKLRSCAGFQIDSQEPKPEVSGRAIMARQQQGERGASHFAGNQGRAVRQLGRILLPMYPVVYDTARIKRISGIDDQERAVQVYAGAENKPQQPKQDPKSKKDIKAFDLSSAGRYDVRTTVGQSMATKRQEAMAVLLDLAKAVPAVGQVGCDIIVKNGDFTGAQELAKRLKRVVVPKEALDENDDTDAQLMKAMMTVQQLSKINELMLKELNAKNQIIETDQLKLDSQERMKQADLQSKELIAQNTILLGILQVKAGTAAKGAQLQAQAEGQAAAQQHEATQADHGRQFDAQQKDQDRQFGHIQNQEKLGAGVHQAHLKGQQAMQQTHMKGQQAAAQQTAAQLQERVITTMDHSQQEHMAEITASQQQDAQEREIKAQQDQAKMQQGPDGGGGQQ